MNKNYQHTYQSIDNTTVLWQSNITKSQQEKLDSILENEMLLHVLVMNVEALSCKLC